MKKLLFSTALIGASIFAHAQFSIGPKIGFGLANIKESGDGASNDTKGGLAPTIGLDAKIGIIKYFSIQPSLQLQVLGAKADQTINGNKYRVREYLGYLQLPVKFNFQYPITKVMTVGVGVGPYIGYYLGGGVNTPDNKDNTGTKIKAKSNVKPGDATDVGYIKPLDAGIVIAPFIQIGFLQIAPTVSFGLSNLNPKNNGQTSKLVSRNLYYGLQLSFLFGKR